MPAVQLRGRPFDKMHGRSEIHATRHARTWNLDMSMSRVVVHTGWHADGSTPCYRRAIVTIVCALPPEKVLRRFQTYSERARDRHHASAGAIHIQNVFRMRVAKISSPPAAEHCSAAAGKLRELIRSSAKPRAAPLLEKVGPS